MRNIFAILLVATLLSLAFLSDNVMGTEAGVHKWPSSASGDTTYTLNDMTPRLFESGAIPPLEYEFTEAGGLNVSGYTAFDFLANGDGVKFYFLDSDSLSTTGIGRIDSVYIIDMGSASSVIMTAR